MDFTWAGYNMTTSPEDVWKSRSFYPLALWERGKGVRVISNPF
jgi:hypothetical protein